MNEAEKAGNKIKFKKKSRWEQRIKDSINSIYKLIYITYNLGRYIGFLSKPTVSFKLI